mmetsp:Transcript_7774/g.30700  ORF Transcript_7774/g.30700 Transcript_7774/m.30700 type:complete len:405 (+) Transcript_7774:342-1556(+)
MEAEAAASKSAGSPPETDSSAPGCPPLAPAAAAAWARFACAAMRRGCRSIFTLDFILENSTLCFDSSTAMTFLFRCLRRLLSISSCLRCSRRLASIRFSSAESSLSCWARKRVSRCLSTPSLSSSILVRSRSSSSSAMRFTFCASPYFFCLASSASRLRQSSSSLEYLGGARAISSLRLSWNTRSLSRWRSVICLMYISAIRSYSSRYLSQAEVNSANCMLFAMTTSCLSAACRALSARRTRRSSCLRSVLSWLVARSASRYDPSPSHLIRYSSKMRKNSKTLASGPSGAELPRAETSRSTNSWKVSSPDRSGSTSRNIASASAGSRPSLSNTCSNSRVLIAPDPSVSNSAKIACSVSSSASGTAVPSPNDATEAPEAAMVIGRAGRMRTPLEFRPPALPSPST